MEKNGSPFADLPLSFVVVFVDTVDLAESTRRDGVPDRRVDKLENSYSVFLLIRLFELLSTGTLPLALFVFIAESMRIGRRSARSRECG